GVDRARGEAAADDLPGLGVVRRVLVDPHHALQLDLLAGHVRGAAGDDAALVGRAVLAVLRDRGDVRVLADRPEAVVEEAGPRLGRLLHPPDGRSLAELEELLQGDPLLTQTGVGRVEASRHYGRCGHGCPPHFCNTF